MPTSLNLTEKVSEFIMQKISKGIYLPGDLIPSERELSETIDVSRVTIRRGLKQLIDEGLLEAKSKKGYIVPIELPIFENQKHKMGPILFLHSFEEEDLLQDQDHLELWAGARLEAAKYGQMIVICSLPNWQKDFSKLADLLSTAGGVICDIGDEAFIKKIQKKGIPVIQIHSARKSDDFIRVVQDDFAGIEKAYLYLQNKGFKNIAYFDASASLRNKQIEGNSEKRFAAYLLSCAKFNQKPLVKEVNFYQAPELNDELVPAKTDAIIIPHIEIWDYTRAWFENHPEIKVVLWGKSAQDAINKGVTAHIVWSKKNMGATATRLLIENMKHPNKFAETVLIRTELIEG
jgi:biotin operon repressor